MDTTKTLLGSLAPDSTVQISFKHIPFYLLRPLRFFKEYDTSNFRPDLMAGLTLGIILLPQAIAFALIAELPPQMGLFAAIVAGVIGALWGSSPHVYTGPTNAISLLVLSSLLTVATPGTPEFIIAAGVMAVMAGLFQLSLGLVRLGGLVNFVSYSVVVGFSTGAGVLIGVNQIRSLFGLNFSSRNVIETVHGVVTNIGQLHIVTTALGIGAIIFIVTLKKFYPKLPGAFLSMALASVVVFIFGLNQRGVSVIGQLPTSLPPLANLPLFDLDFIARLSTGAFAVGAIGLVATSAISRSMSAQTGQRLDSNQEFVGQGLANIAAGFFSGYPVAGSFSLSAVNFTAGAKSGVSAMISSGVVLIGLFVLAPLAVYLPRAALSGVLVVTAYNMVDQQEIKRIFRGARGDTLIMLVTFLGTLFLHIEFAVLLGIMLSFAIYITNTSLPRVFPVVPNLEFNHFVEKLPTQPGCPQLGIIKISGDLYFGAVNHVEEVILQHLMDNPRERFILFRMQGVNNCDFSGIYMLESVRRTCQERGGDIFFMKLQRPVREFMLSTGFMEELGSGQFLHDDEAISHLFHRVLDPAVCIYECEMRTFVECQNLPKRTYPGDISPVNPLSPQTFKRVSPQELWEKLQNGVRPLVVDVRERREFNGGHVPYARSIPLPTILEETPDLPKDQPIFLVCRSGRRSNRAAQALINQGYNDLVILQGGMLAWNAANLLEAIEM